MEMKRVPVIGSAASKAGTTTGPTSTRSSKKFRSKLDQMSKGTYTGFNFYHNSEKKVKHPRRSMLHLQDRAKAEQKMMDKFTIVDHQFAQGN